MPMHLQPILKPLVVTAEREAGSVNAVASGADSSIHTVPAAPEDGSQSDLAGGGGLAGGRNVLQEISMDVTFSVMARRRIRRQLGGVRKPVLPGLTRALWIFLYLGIGVGFVGLQGGFSDVEVRIEIFPSTSSFVFFTLILMIVWVALKSYTVVRLCLAWLLVGTGLVLVISSKPDSGSGSGGRPAPGIPFLPLFDWGSSTQQVVIAIVTLVMITITCVLWFGVFYVYPSLVICMERCRTVRKLWNIERDVRALQSTSGALSFTYTPVALASCLPWPFSLCADKRRQFTYEGALGDDEQGRAVPHGWGTWTDTSRHGERLTGWWEMGIPIGPFRSLELRTGCAFASLRIGVASNVAYPWNEWRAIPVTTPTLTWGVVGVEVSIAGDWFKGLPAAHLVAPFEPRDAGWAIEHLLHVGHSGHHGHTHRPSSSQTPPHTQRSPTARPDDELQSVVISLGCPHDRLHVCGHRAGPGTDATSAIITLQQPTTHGATPSLRVQGGWQVGTSAQEALLWIPGFNASTDVICTAVAQLLALGAFPAHIKPFVFSWPNGLGITYPIAESLASSALIVRDLTETFRSLLDDAHIDQIHVLVHSMGAQLFFAALPHIVDLLGERAAKLATCILLNADSPLEQFVDSSYPLLRQCCHHITVYADVNDMALYYSKFIYRLSTCLPFVRTIATRQPLGRYPTKLHGEADRTTEAIQDHLELRVELPADYLDLDVVDASMLDSNVHGLRHCYFNLNSFIVDDLAEIVTTRRRACMRRRLTHSVGNVWCFLAAPSHVDEI